MSHRTEELPPASGVARFVRELRYHEVSRQLLAVVLILLFALTSVPSQPIVFIGLALAFVGMLIRLHASGFVMKNKELAQNGPYALMRHPLYTGNILLITGFALANGAIWPLVLALFFFWFYYPTAIEYEDRKLHNIFGDEWRVWSARTPALIPNMRNVGGLFSGQWSFAKSTMQNGEIVIVVFVLISMGIVIWHLSLR